MATYADLILDGTLSKNSEVLAGNRRVWADNNAVYIDNLVTGHHERDVALRCHASSEVASVAVSLHPEFQGKWELRGATHSRYRGPGSTDGDKTDRGVHRFVVDEDSFGWINRLTKGRTWWDLPDQPSGLPKKAEATIATQVGLALLTFK